MSNKLKHEITIDKAKQTPRVHEQFSLIIEIRYSAF
jgi:hypothetical protein